MGCHSGFSSSVIPFTARRQDERCGVSRWMHGKHGCHRLFMESMAAVGLVSIAIAPIAYEQGIDPIHFWMTCLVALELGYLSPPVALSHIFTRQVVGEEEALAASHEGDTFYYRHERLLLPLLVMGTTLLIVGFGPLLYGISG